METTNESTGRRRASAFVVHPSVNSVSSVVNSLAVHFFSLPTPFIRRASFLSFARS
jgi:hypothetical protein